MYIFNRELCQNLDLLFLEGVFHEDELFTPQLFINASRIGYLPLDLFNRRIRSESTMTKKFSKRNLFDYLKVTDGLSKAVESKDENEIINTVSVFKKLLYLTALIGLIIMIIASPLISSLSFGSNKYILSFTLLSLLVFFNTLSTGNSSILRGIRDLKRYALFSLTGSITSL